MPAPEEQRQLTLAEIQEGFASIGVEKVEELPDGVSTLNPRELRFVLGVLNHGQMAKAAVEAGYSAESAGQIASETLRKPKVFAFYRRCVDKLANNADRAVARVYERSVILHAKALEASQTKANAEEWIILTEKHETTRGSESTTKKDVREYERIRDRAQRDEKHYVTLANQTDALLATLLGKVAGVLVSGEIRHTHGGTVTAVVPETALGALANARRDVLVARRDGTLPMPNMGGAN